MTPELAKLLERMRQRREQRAADPSGARGVDAPLGAVRGQAHPLGAKVFDPVTGQVGEVISGGSENVVIPTPK